MDACRSQAAFDELVALMARLRSEQGCPWDREQTHRSLKRYLLEESYELLDAIDDGDDEHLRDELGDLLLQVVFHAQIAQERGAFDVCDVVTGLSRKLIRRHPHVFGDVRAETPSEVVRNWDAIKQAEKGASDQPTTSLLDGIPRHLPALAYAEKVQAKAAKVGFEWPDVSGALDKVREETGELVRCVQEGASPEQVEEEFGDLLFALVNVARYLGVEPEGALRRTARKFISRFQHIEARAREAGRELASMSLEEMDALWDEAKSLEPKAN